MTPSFQLANMVLPGLIRAEELAEMYEWPEEDRKILGAMKRGAQHLLRKHKGSAVGGSRDGQREPFAVEPSPPSVINECLTVVEECLAVVDKVTGETA